jgi:hypothetical protein
MYIHLWPGWYWNSPFASIKSLQINIWWSEHGPSGAILNSSGRITRVKLRFRITCTLSPVQ